MGRSGLVRGWNMAAWLLAAGGMLAGCIRPVQVAAIPQVAVTDAPPEVVELALEPVLGPGPDVSANDPAPTEIAATPTPSMIGPEYFPGSTR